MTIAERNNKLKHFIACLKCEVSGKPCDVNCSTQYDAGNMGEIIENLEAISKALEQEPKSEWQHDHEILKAYSDGANEVLEKIRADLYKLYNDRPRDYNHSQRTELFCEVIKILDKYKGESEDKE
jgi:hypothetical protein